jgi:PST family polysaccharide transporter
LASVESLSGLLGLFIAIAVALATRSYWALVIQQVTASLLQFTFAILATDWRPGWPSGRGLIRDHLRFGRDTAAVQTLNYMASNADSVLIGRNLGATALGQYSRAYSLAVLPGIQIATPLTRIVLPKLTALEMGERELALRRYQSVLSYGQLAPLSLLGAVAHPMIPFLMGPRWPAVPELLQIELIGAACTALGYVFYWAFLVERRTGLMVISEGVCEIAMVVAMILVVSQGTATVAWVVSAGQFTIMLALAAMASWALHFRVRELALVARRPLLILGVAAVAGAEVVARSGVSSPLLGTIVAGASWAVVVLAGCAVSGRARADIRSLIRTVAKAE